MLFAPFNFTENVIYNASWGEGGLHVYHKNRKAEAKQFIEW